MTRARKRVVKIKIDQDKNKIINDLSKKSEFLNLLKSKEGAKNGGFLYKKTITESTKFTIDSIKIFKEFIAANKDKISIFKTTRAKYAINIAAALLKIEAIR